MKKILILFAVFTLSHCTRGPLHQVSQSRHVGSFLGQWSNRVVLDSQLVTDGKFFYYGNRQGKVFCIDAENLNKVWKHSFDSSVDTSVLVDDTQAYVGTADGMLHALDKKNGKQIWEISVSAPARGAMTKVGSKVIVGTNDGEVNAVDQKDGKILWKYRHEPYEKMKIQFFIEGSVEQNRLFIGFPNGQITALNIETGEEIWKQWLTDANSRFYDIGSILLIPQKGILVTAVEGASVFFTFEGQQMWSRSATSTQARPLWLNDQILIAAKDEIVGLDINGSEKMKIAYPKSLRPAGLVYEKGLIHVSTLDGSLNVFDEKKSTMIWEYHMGISIQGAPVILNDQIWTLNRRGQIIGMAARK